MTQNPKKAVGMPVFFENEWWLVSHVDHHPDEAGGDLLSLRSNTGAGRYDVPEDHVATVSQAYVDRDLADRVSVAAGLEPGLPVRTILDGLEKFARHSALCPFDERRQKAADERYGEQALASAIGEWADLLAEANEVLDHKDYETLDSRKLDLGRALVRATSSAMKHTAEAAKMVHASRAKNEGG